ncbi:MAG: NAD(P)/FAD-dependent oxidoreductase [Candidatus Thorarchaeota archaeon]|nr:NAD(P)/FAD-dependent oxidoreductase [Candidatus Thorarchaeota archaeon]
MSPDIAIIGAGPAGLLAAREAALQGVDVLVLEEHEEVGVPDHCAGLLSVTGLASLGLKPPSHVIQNHVRGAVIYAPSGHSIHIERGKREALVIDRRAFDRWLAERAINSGVEVRTGVRVTEVIHKQYVEGVRIGKDRTDLKASVVIDGEGSRCVISKSVGLPGVPRKSMRPAYQFEVRGTNIHEDLVEMFYGNQIAPGFFAWIIPLGEGRARVGLAARDRSKIRLQAAMKHHPIIRERLQDATIERGFGGIVLVGLPVKRTYTTGLMVVGDAAGMVKATTGGGVIIGGAIAQIAGVVGAEALKREDVSQQMLEKYERAWQARYSRDLKAMYLTQQVIGALSDKGLDLLISNAAELGLLDTVKRAGDMDMQGEVILKLLRRPATALAGLNVIRHLNLIHL